MSQGLVVLKRVLRSQHRDRSYKFRLAQAFLPPNVPIICVSKGLEVGTGAMMSELIPEALGRKQPAVFLSGPSFAKEVMDQCPTGVVAACKVRFELSGLP